MKKKAFTLAEVLITLTIIGVIAALTIPSLMQKHQEQEMITRLRKAHSIFSNAYKLSIAENGDPNNWDIGELSSTNDNEAAVRLYKYFEPYLKIQKYCGNKAGCFANKYKALFNDNFGTDINNAKEYAKAVLEDGSAIFFFYAGEGNKDTFGDIDIDVNGKKGPNKAGVDLFYFRIDRNGSITPYKHIYANNAYNRCVYKDNFNKNGTVCTWWAIYRGNMDYLRRDISNEW